MSVSVLEPGILQFKLDVPHQRISLVERPRLLSQLTAVAAHRLCLLIAPAGFGKTTLLAQWNDHLARSGRRLAWLSLDEEDSDTRRFLTCVIFALDRAGLDTGRLRAHAEQGVVDLTADACLVLLAEALARAVQSMVLVLDDYHRAADPQLNNLILRLVHLSPETFTVLLSSRVRPNIGVPQLLASGLASEIAAEPLRLTADEIATLFGTDLPESTLATLVDQTEGWPVALQLARLVLKNDPTAAGAVRRLTARGGHLSTYLADQVLASLPGDVTNFLLETSILEAFDVSLADSVRERSDSWKMMEALEPLQSLLTPLDPERGWFRYHHLFAEYLRNRLAQQQPDHAARLHLRASLWFERQGLLQEAVRHAREASDYKRCARLIEDAGGWRLILYGGINHLRSLLRYVPDQERVSHPRLLLAKAYLDMKDGQLQAARENFNLATEATSRRGRAASETAALERDALNVGTLLKIYEDDGLDEEMLEGFEQLRATAAADDPLTLGVLDCAEAVVSLCVGRLHHAEAKARAAMKSMRGATSVLGLNYCYLHGGMSALYRGELATSRAYLSEARRMAEENFGGDSGLKAISDVLCGALHFWRTGEPDVSLAEYEHSTQHVRAYDGWFDVYAAGLDVRFRMALSRGDGAEMLSLIDESHHLLPSRVPRRLSNVLQAHRLVAAIQQGARSEARLAGRSLQQQLPIGAWRADRRLWRPYQDVALALARWQQECGDEDLALRTLSDLADCCLEIQATLPRIRALVNRGVLRGELGRRDEAVADMALAVGLAAAEHVAQPFKEQPGSGTLLRHVNAKLREDVGDPIQIDFVSSLLREIDTSPRDAAEGRLGMFSPRERDVVQELRHGLTNKEIARALDMTEHTVKFHLRNIFLKLGVERRGQALTMLQSGRDWLRA